MKNVISTDKAPAAIGPYSQAFRKSAYGSYLLPLTLLPRSVQTKKNKQ